jgi:hypothetical protein
MRNTMENLSQEGLSQVNFQIQDLARAKEMLPP